MTEDIILGTFYTVYMTDESSVAVDPEDAVLVDRAMKVWAERRIDAWITLRSPGGNEFSMLASTITSTQRTTPEQRAFATMRDKAMEDERKENRRNAGFIETE